MEGRNWNYTVIDTYITDETTYYLKVDSDSIFIYLFLKK